VAARFNILQAICGQFTVYLIGSLVPSTMLAYIQADLGSTGNSAWITISWQLGACIVVSIGGRLSDIFGRRHFMITGSALGIIGCLIGATGQSVHQMIISGVIFGLGAGFQELSYACIQEMVPNKHRMTSIGQLPHC